MLKDTLLKRKINDDELDSIGGGNRYYKRTPKFDVGQIIDVLKEDKSSVEYQGKILTVDSELVYRVLNNDNGNVEYVDEYRLQVASGSFYIKSPLNAL